MTHKAIHPQAFFSGSVVCLRCVPVGLHLKSKDHIPRVELRLLIINIFNSKAVKAFFAVNCDSMPSQAPNKNGKLNIVDALYLHLHWMVFFFLSPIRFIQPSEEKQRVIS